MSRTNSQQNQTEFEGWHYHASFGLVKMRRIWGQDLQKTYPIAETTLPTPTTPLPDSDSELYISPNMDTSYISQTEQELSLVSDTSSFTASSAPSFLSDSESASGVDFPGLGLFGVVTDDCHIRPVGRLHRLSRSLLSPSHTVISEALLDEVYATFCNTSLKNEQQWRPQKTLTRTQSQPIRAFKTLGHSRSTVSSSLKKTNRSISGKLERAPSWR
ncbi:hypothetical protein BDZ89DRAFT_1153169 [Hymenopellis radicata]|nr:hypothetical protein BDZ89DRAFT_1153169 [Hymenopellis radicata]